MVLSSKINHKDGLLSIVYKRVTFSTRTAKFKADKSKAESDST
jgi:hypothetical protein